MKNIILISIIIILVFVSFKRSNTLQQQNTQSTPENFAVIEIKGDTMKCKTTLFIKGEKFTKFHSVNLSKETYFDFVSKAGQRIEIKITNYKDRDKLVKK